MFQRILNPLNAKLNPISHLLALLGAHHILHVSRIRVNPYPALNTSNITSWSSDRAMRFGFGDAWFESHLSRLLSRFSSVSAKCRDSTPQDLDYLSSPVPHHFQLIFLWSTLDDIYSV
jgi:hypothetical protein